jgi:hypothetical protein
MLTLEKRSLEPEEYTTVGRSEEANTHVLPWLEKGDSAIGCVPRVTCVVRVCVYVLAGGP